MAGALIRGPRRSAVLWGWGRCRRAAEMTGETTQGIELKEGAMLLP